MGLGLGWVLGLELELEEEQEEALAVARDRETEARGGREAGEAPASESSTEIWGLGKGRISVKMGGKC